MRYVIAAMLAVCGGMGWSAWAYEEIVFGDGGTLTGTVSLKGKVPRPKGYNLTTLPDQTYCGRISDGQGWRLLQPFQVGEKGAFQEVVVYLEGVEKGKAFPPFTAPRVEAMDCRFLPFSTVVRDEQDVVVVNMDPVMHDIQAYETSNLGPRVLFNVPLPMNPSHPRDIKDTSDAAKYHRHLAGQPMKQFVNMTKGRRVFVMQCGFHAYMESWGLAAEHPYYTVTDENGRFEIGDIPPGTYKLVVWHPYMGEAKEQTVTIEPKTQTQADVVVSAPVGRLYVNQMVDKPYTRYGITDDARTKIVPTLIHQEP